ncbi:baseplate J/gp47 family protein [Desulfovibrio cuneatus]|uniref:baseplate J/gp47 family protein n=1 Tax=Desulfovibrio cuneatus TaxID=159728 RepID=UPI0004056495|nr:baseplate J/gp47 family protein [Desulfovibrio cuneatus]
MRTPAQVPVHKTLEECRELVFSHVQEVHEDYQNKGWLPARLNLNAGIVRGLLEIYAWVLWAFYEFLRRSLPQAFPLQAEGDWLNLHADQVTLERREATRASGHVLFSRAPGVTGNIRIPAGRIVRTRPDGRGNVYRYITQGEAVLPNGEETVAVPVQAEEYGQAANATAGQICEISTHIPGIAGVNNTEDWLQEEGANTETDAQLQERYVLAWLEKAGCTAAAYKSWALAVPAVLTAEILDQHPRGEGTVDVVVRGTAGIPTESLLEKVRASIAHKIPVNDRWLVKAPVEVPVALLLHAEFSSGSPETGKQEVENRLRALFPGSGSNMEDVPTFGIGEDFTRDKAVAACIGKVAGLKRLVWQTPADVVAVPQDGLVALASLTLTAGMVQQ